MLETTRLTQPDICALALDALDAQHIELSLDVAEGVVQAGHLRSYASRRDAFDISPG